MAEATPDTDESGGGEPRRAKRRHQHHASSHQPHDRDQSRVTPPHFFTFFTFNLRPLSIEFVPTYPKVLIVCECRVCVCMLSFKVKLVLHRLKFFGLFFYI